MKIDSVCKDCTERHLGCHSSCDLYINAKDKYEAEKLKVRAIKEKSNDLKEFRDSCYRKTMRGRGKKV